MRFYLTLALCAIICAFNVPAVQINEINFDPEGPDNNKEYVELYLPDKTNISGWIIADADSNDTLQSMNTTNSSYALIVEDGFNSSGLNCSIYSAGAAIGNSLNNEEDNISIYNGTLIDSAHYNISTADSLSHVNNSWKEIQRTPCKENIQTKGNNTSNKTNTTKTTCSPALNINTKKDTYNYNETLQISHKTNATNFSITYWIQTLDGDKVKDKYTTSNLNEKSWTADTKHSALLIKSYLVPSCNKTLNITEEKLIAIKHNESNQKNKTTTAGCNPKINITTEKNIYNYDEKIEFKHSLENASEDFSITYWIESLGGETLKDKYTTDNLNQKSWTADTKHSAVLIKSNLKTPCSNEKYQAKKLLAVRQNKELDTGIEILDINTGRDGKIEFGEVFTTEMKITKAETDKYSIKAYVINENNKVSETTRTHLHEKNSETKLTIPIALQQNCNKKHTKGNYKLKIQGLGKEAEKTIYLNHNNDCTTKTVEKKVKRQTPKISSFYTLMENYHKKINLYATFDNINKSRELLLETLYKNKTYTINNNSRLKMKARAKRGKNIYVLQFTNDEQVDTAYLKINFPQKNETVNFSLNTNNKTQNNQSSNKITGNIYRSAGMKSKETSKYLIAGLAVIISGYMFYSRQTIRKLFKRPFFMLKDGSANSGKSNNRDARLSKRAH